MSWNCIYTPLAIRVNYGPLFKGYYEFILEPFCKKCSSPGVTTDECLLQDLVYGFDAVHAMGEYNAHIRDPYPLLTSHIRFLKDYDRTDLAAPLGYGLHVILKNKYPELLKADFYVPVPAHSVQLRNRGFNQVDLIVDSLSQKTSITSLSCLEKLRHFEMRNLNLEERYEAVKGAYNYISSFDNTIKDKYVVLIDDVVSSCATASECSKILRDNGARKVDVLTCGRNRLD